MRCALPVLVALLFAGHSPASGQGSPATIAAAATAAAKDLRGRLPQGLTRVGLSGVVAARVPDWLIVAGRALEAPTADRASTVVCQRGRPDTCVIDDATVYLEFLNEPVVRGDAVDVALQAWYMSDNERQPVQKEIWRITVCRTSSGWRVTERELLEIT